MKGLKSLASSNGGYVNNRGGVVNIFFNEISAARKVAETLLARGYEVIGVCGTQVQVVSP
jgi:hypothetical protein